MDKKLFEAVLQESNYGLSEVETEEQLKTLFDAGVEIEAHHTGPFGEDTGAVVVGVGTVADLRDEIIDDEGELDEYMEDDDEVVVISERIGQGGGNWYDLGSYNVSDLDLWASTAQMDKVLHNKEVDDKEVDVCPNCGSNDFFDKEFDGKMYKGCKNCGAFFPKKN